MKKGCVCEKGVCGCGCGWGQECGDVDTWLRGRVQFTSGRGVCTRSKKTSYLGCIVHFVEECSCVCECKPFV